MPDPVQGIPIPKRPRRLTEGAVYVEWVDSWSAHGWEFPDRIQPEPLVKCQSIGFLLREDDMGIHIVGTRHSDHKGSVHGHIAIPRAAITRLERL